MDNKNIQKTQKKTYVKSALFLRKFSVIIAYYLDKLGIQPNRVVLFRVFVFGSSACILFFQPSYWLNVLGMGAIFLCYFFDLVDGDLARNHNKKTDFGKFLDEELDSVVVTSIILTFVLKFYYYHHTPIFMYGGIFALFGMIGSAKMTYFFKHMFSVNCVGGHDALELQSKQDREATSWFFYELMTPKNFFMSLFSNIRYFLLFGIVTDTMPLMILSYALLINLRWILLFICVAKYYNRKDGSGKCIALFKTLRTIENPAE